MYIFSKNNNKISLSTNDYLSSGGQAVIYKKRNIVYKIFHDKKNMIPEAKIDELSILKHKSIINPKEIFYNQKRSPVGFSLEWINGIPLCKLFTTGFRNRNNITNDHTIKLIDNIKDTIKYIHQNKILIVDGNEMNYLVDKDFITPYMIDVDSWQTKSYKANAVMDSIKDYFTNTFNELSDWYSFAVISCLLFVGVHPYRGNHPDYNESDILERTKKRTLDKISIFNPKVKVAPNSRINSVPQSYKDWFIKIFERGERCLPPGEIGQIIIISSKTFDRKSNNFIINLIEKYDENIIWVSKINGIKTIKTSNSIIYNNDRIKCSVNDNITFSLNNKIPIISKIEKGKLILKNLSNQMRNMIPYDCNDLMIINNSLFFKNNEKLSEISIEDIEINNNNIVTDFKALPVVKNTWNIMPNSSKFFAGVIYQEIFNLGYLTIPVVKNDSKTKCITKAIPELNNLKILDAKHENRIVSIYTFDNKGIYNIIIIRFDKEYKNYESFKILCDDIGDINMTVLDNGVCILIPYDETVYVFTNQLNSNINKINDSKITIDMRLTHDLNNAMFFKGKELYSIKMK